VKQLVIQGVVNGGSVIAGTVNQGAEYSRDFLLTNSGDVDLTISAIDLSTADFAVVGTPPTIIQAIR
jgi:hypothetical protein